MLRQYHAQRCYLRTLADGRTVRIGTISAGTILRFPALGATVEVLGWYNREVGATHRDGEGRWQSSLVAGGHMALCRDLRTGACIRITDWELLGAAERGDEVTLGRGNPRALRRARRQGRRLARRLSALLAAAHRATIAREAATASDVPVVAAAA